MSRFLNILAGRAKASVPQDSDIFINANGINKTLYQAIVDGQIGGATATDYNTGTNAQMETAAGTALDFARWGNTDHFIEYMFIKKRWIPFGTPDFRFGGVKFDDFDSNTGAGNIGWTIVGTANPASGTTTSPGIIGLRTTAASTRAAISLRSTAILLGGTTEHNIEFIVRMPTLATGTDDFVCTFGLNDTNAFDSNGHATDGVYFAYNRASNGNSWQLVTANNGTRTTTNTATAIAANTWYNIWVKIKGTTSADFYIWSGSAWTLLGTHTTNLPSGTGRETGVQVKVDRTVSAASASLGFDIDEFYHWYAFGASRV